jgi:hypothetical protein
LPVAQQRGGFRDTCRGTAACRATPRDGKFPGRNELAPNNIKLPVTYALPICRILLSTEKPVNGPADFEGSKEPVRVLLIDTRL